MVQLCTYCSSRDYNQRAVLQQLVPHVLLYNSTVNNVLFTASSRTPDERVRTLSCLFSCFLFTFVFGLFLGRVSD